MSAVRKLKRVPQIEEKPVVLKSIKTTEPLVVVQPFQMTLVTITLIAVLVAATSYLGISVLRRNAQIAELQLEIFNTQQDINKATVMIDELYVARESFMTIEEIEKYASEELNMIKPSDQQKVSLRSDNYMTLDPQVAFQTNPPQSSQASWWQDSLQLVSAMVNSADE